MSIILPPINPTHGLTLEEMITLIANETRNTNRAAQITSWLNIALLELAYEYVFGELHKNGTLLTNPSLPDVNLASDFLWIKSIEIPAENRKLYPENEQLLSESHPNYRTLTGTVTGYYVNGAILGLYQVPPDVKTLTYTYQRQPLKLVELTTLCDLPAAWHGMVVQKAITKAYSSDGNTEAKLSSEKNERELLKRLGGALYRRRDETIVFGGIGRRSRPPRPKLPASFPRG